MGTSWRDLEWNWRYVGYDWRHPTYPSRLAFSGFGLLTFGLLETLILGMWIGLSDVEVRGVGTMVAFLPGWSLVSFQSERQVRKHWRIRVNVSRIYVR